MSIFPLSKEWKNKDSIIPGDMGRFEEALDKELDLREKVIMELAKELSKLSEHSVDDCDKEYWLKDTPEQIIQQAMKEIQNENHNP